MLNVTVNIIIQSNVIEIRTKVGLKHVLKIHHVLEHS